MGNVVNYCDKCGRRLVEPAVQPAYCPKCELVNALLVERYTRIPRNSADK